MTVRFVPLVFLVMLAACETEPSETVPSNADGPRTAARSGAPDTAMVRDVTVGGTADLVREDPNRVSPSVAIQTIDLWIARLDTASVVNGAEIREGLTTLRNQLQSSPLDGEAIGRTMKALGEQTAEVADSSGADLGALAAALSAAGERLAPEPVAADSVTFDDA